MIKQSGPGQNLDYLRRTFPNMLFLEAFNSYRSPSQFLVPRVDGVWSVSSNVAYQAMLFGRLLGTPPSTHLAGIAHTTKLAEFFEILGRVPPAEPRCLSGLATRALRRATGVVERGCLAR